MEIDLDTDRCIGAARCVRFAPALFTQDDDGVVALLADRVPAEEEHRLAEAVLACPVQAIRRR